MDDIKTRRGVFRFEVTNCDLKKYLEGRLPRRPQFGLKYHFGTSSWGGTRKLPRAFTEQGVAMLSSVLKSKRAVRVNIEIMRAFVKLRQLVSSHKDLLQKIEDMENKYDHQFRVVFEAIKQLMAPPDPSKKRIGFEAKEPKADYARK
jgi:hypothetical protein